MHESENCLSSDYMKRSMTSVAVLPTGPIRKRSNGNNSKISNIAKSSILSFSCEKNVEKKSHFGNPRSIYPGRISRKYTFVKV
jgi:hypothetical protein